MKEAKILVQLYKEDGCNCINCCPNCPLYNTNSPEVNRCLAVVKYGGTVDSNTGKCSVKGAIKKMALEVLINTYSKEDLVELLI